MALKIPDVKESSPSQGAFQQTDPSQAFGKMVAPAGAMPSVPNNYAPRSMVDGSEAYAGGQAIAKGFGAIVDSLNNVQVREKALKTAQEHMSFKESELDARKQLSDAEREIEEKAATEYWTVDQKKDAMTAKRGEILTSVFDPEKYTDTTLKGNVKLTHKAYDIEYDEKYLKTVIEPERVAAIEGGIIKTIEYTLGLAATSKSPQEVQAAHASLVELSNTPGFQALSPQKRMAYMEKAHMGIETGIADHVISSLPTDSPVKAKQILDNMIANPAMLPLLSTGDRDKATRDGNLIIERSKRDIEDKRRQAEADREKKQRDWQNNNQYDLMLKVRKGQVSEAEVTKALVSGRIDKQAAVQLLGSVDARNEKYAREHLAYKTVETMTANGMKVSDETTVNKWYETAKKGAAGMAPAQKGQYFIQQFSKIGMIPKEYKNETLGMLNSDNPAVYKSAVERMRYIKSVDPRLMQSFDKDIRVVVEQADTGMPVTQLMKNRDNQKNMTVSEYQQRDNDYKDLNKKDGNKTPTVKHLEKEFDGVVNDKMRGLFEETVKQNYLGGMSMPNALKIATQDFHEKWGRTGVDGTNRVMENPPEKAYNQSPEVLQRQLKKDVESLGMKDTKVALYFGGMDKSNKPYYIMSKYDKTVDAWVPVRGENNQTVKWQYDPMQDVELLKQQAEQKKEYDLAQKEYAEKSGKLIEIDSSSKYVKKYPNK